MIQLYLWCLVLWSIVFYCGVLFDVVSFALFDVSFMWCQLVVWWLTFRILAGNFFDGKTLFNKEGSNFNLLDNVPRRQVPWHVDVANGGFGSIKVSATFEDSTWAQIFAEKGEMREESWKEKWIKLRKWKTSRNLWIYAPHFMELYRPWAELLS